MQCLENQLSLRQDHLELCQVLENVVTCIEARHLMNVWQQQEGQTSMATSVGQDIPTSTTIGEEAEVFVFSITISKAHDMRLGMSIICEADTQTLLVASVDEGGAVASFNKLREAGDFSLCEQVVSPGDRIVSVNQVQGNAQRMLEECESCHVAEFVLSRSSAQQAHPPQSEWDRHVWPNLSHHDLSGIGSAFDQENFVGDVSEKLRWNQAELLTPEKVTRPPHPKDPQLVSRMNKSPLSATQSLQRAPPGGPPGLFLYTGQCDQMG